MADGLTITYCLLFQLNNKRCLSYENKKLYINLKNYEFCSNRNNFYMHFFLFSELGIQYPIYWTENGIHRLKFIELFFFYVGTIVKGGVST